MAADLEKIHPVVGLWRPKMRAMQGVRRSALAL